MVRRIAPALFCLSVLLLAVRFAAAGVTFRVDESATRVRLGDERARVSLALDNPTNQDFTARVVLELLDAKGRAVSTVEGTEKIKAGASTLELPLPFSAAGWQAREQIPWYRLRYRITPAHDSAFANATEGIISLSEITPDLFELQVTGPAYSYEGMRYRARVRAAHPLSARAARGVRVEGEMKFDEDGEDKAKTIRASATTDADGYAALDFELPRNVSGDEAQIKVTGRLNDFVQVAEDNVDFPHLAEILMSTDKSIYQPGQTLHVRALFRDPLARRALADTEAVLIVSDPGGTDVFRAPLRTSRFGIASADWPIADNTRLGDYRIKIEIEGGRYDDSENSQSIRISRYDLPNFVVNAKPDRGYYLPGENAEIVVSADYVFGRPVKRGRVRVVREAEREWNYAAQKWDVKEEEKFEGETDEAGRFVARVDLAEAHRRLDGEGEYTRFEDLSYAAYFTDPTTNRTEQRRFDLRVTREAIHVYVVSDNYYGQTRDFPLRFYLTTFYADGSPAACDVAIDEETGEREVAQVAAGSDGQSLPALPSNRRRLRTVRTNERGVAKIDELPLPPGAARDSVSLKLSARDAAGRTGSDSKEFDLGERTLIRVETEKTIHRAGEPIKMRVVSNRPAPVVSLDVLRQEKVLHSQIVRLRDGRASLKIPFRKEFRDELVIAAQTLTPSGDDEPESGTHTVIYPRERELQFDVRFDKNEYRPGEEASAEIRVRDPEGREVEGALGVVVTDRAVDERARTDREFGAGGGGNNRYLRQALGENEELSGVTRRDLDHLDYSKPLAPALDLVTEIMLNRSQHYTLNTFGGGFNSNQRELFSAHHRPQMKLVEEALGARYGKLGEYPKDETALRRILSDAGINLDALRDPWGMPYRVRFGTSRESDVLEIVSAAADKRVETGDDFTVARLSWPYFRPVGEAIQRAVAKYQERTGALPESRAALRSELLGEKIDLDALRDPWGHPYEMRFGRSGKDFVVTVVSGGPDGRFDSASAGQRDDFDVWTARASYFAPTEQRINAALNERVKRGADFPGNEAEFREFLRRSGIADAALRDQWGRPYVPVFNESFWQAGRVRIRSYERDGKTDKQQEESRPGKQKLYVVTLRSLGADVKNGADDFVVANFVRVLGENLPAARAPERELSPSVASSKPGQLSGAVTDPQGAAVPGAKVRAEDKASGKTYEVETNEEGIFVFADLPAGFYDVTFEGNGFTSIKVTGVQVYLAKVTDVSAMLDPGGIVETVSVTAGAAAIETTSSQVAEIESLPIMGRRFTSFAKLVPGLAGGRAQASTPRLREYFPETLVWQPSVETDREGRAQIKFKLADNITTWKMSLVGSTIEGELGFTEREIRAFQPFFIEHDPPRVLTEGDEISLPVVLRNYLDKPQAVELQMKPEEWFTPLGPMQKRAQVAAGDAARETFDFRATSSVKDGRQRVTANGSDESDAVEKPVSVHPDGEEITRTSGIVFGEAGTLATDFPSDTLTGTARAELKIYPNLLAHVFEGVEGIMQRPHGCGEQTISSTYPSLLVLRHYKQRDVAGGGELPAAARKAETYTRAGYERLLGYQTEAGGFAYWTGDAPDRALTAYALKFLEDAREVTTVDEELAAKARAWLVGQQREDGAWPELDWNKTPDIQRTNSLTAYVARILAAHTATAGKSGGASSSSPSAAGAKAAVALKRAFAYLARQVEKSGDPYMLANYVLAARASGDAPRAQAAARKLAALAHQEAGQSYWEATASTPFHGWGLAGRIETSALAVRALSLAGYAEETGKDESEAAADRALTSRGLLYLFGHKDEHGVWYSTQATVNVLDTLDALSSNPSGETRRAAKTDEAADKESAAGAGVGEGATAEVFVNDRRAGVVSLPADDQLSGPVAFDLSQFLTSPGNNRVEIRRRGGGARQAAAQLISTHYAPWPDVAARAGAHDVARSSAKGLRLKVGFDRTEAEAAQTITCNVEVARGATGGGGMLLAEIGLPPGVEVDRASLELALKDPAAQLERYDVLPDRLIVYLWPYGNTAARFNFKFTPRYGLRALAAPSLVYDYYNPEARAVVAPTKFVIR
ncbi:MAG TPA: MG2 domain-containing protein [Pyrinomonadaceae bacterium]|nr:MG2 domain-containing protein [Pyrinomonadaceae bacterium]